MTRGRINRKLLRIYEGNTRAVPDHLHEAYDRADQRVFKENGVVWKRPANPRLEKLERWGQRMREC